MKLLFCSSCNDILSLAPVERACTCAKSRGAYDEDLLHAWYSGERAIPLGIVNSSFDEAIRAQPDQGMGERFDAFVIPKICPTFRKVPERSGRS
jgi:hypothetical protein